MRAILYLRLSHSEDTSTSIARQEADLRLRAEREGYEVTEVLTDDGLSGGKVRPNAERALSLLREGQADVLMVWRFDRWSRQGLGALAALIDVLDARPGALFIADRDGLTSGQPAWRIIASVLAEVARMEREATSTRVASSHQALKRAGRYSGGQVPYGYRPAPNPAGPGRVLEVDPEAAAVIREAASRVLAGESAYAVALDFNARGIPARNGGRWAPSTLHSMLEADAIVGRVTHRGELLRGEDGLPRQVWPPVLDLPTWHRLRALYSRPASARPQARRRARLLSGLVTCAGCGRRLTVGASSRGYVSYVCHAKGTGNACPGVAVNADRLEAHVTERFLAEVGSMEVLERVEEVQDDTSLAEVERAVTETASAMAADDADVEALSARLVSLKARRAELRALPVTRTVRLVPTGQTFAEAWEAGSMEERREMLTANVALLAIRKGKRGHKGLDPARVTLLAQPAQALSEVDEQGRRWRAKV